jgi:hypothetical protein
VLGVGDGYQARRFADVHGPVPEARMTATKIPVRGKVKPDHSIKKRWWGCGGVALTWRDDRLSISKLDSGSR